MLDAGGKVDPSTWPLLKQQDKQLKSIALATVGPDLTHLADRATLASGTIDNTPSELARWITDPQGVKPGAIMPPTQLSPSDLADLVAYLQSLK